jgi:hypothetical protein
MSGAMMFYYPTGQEQGGDDADDQLLLLRQPVHGARLAAETRFGKRLGRTVPKTLHIYRRVRALLGHRHVI